MGGATTLLSPLRASALAGLLGVLVVWESFADSLPAAGEATDVALAACLLIPATFVTVWLALPLARAQRLPLVALALGGIAVVCDLAGLDGFFNVAKLAAYVLIGFWFVELFQVLFSILLVAALIPIVDILSVWRGPTKEIVEHEPGLFERVSISFRLPGEDSSANLGPPDVFFFALFLGTAARYHLRTASTWIVMTTLLSLTLALTAVFDLSGLPALPAVSLGFLLANADLIWRALRRPPEQAADAAK